MSIIEPTYNYIGWNNEDPDEHLEKYKSASSIFQELFKFSTKLNQNDCKIQNCLYTDTYE